MKRERISHAGIAAAWSVEPNGGSKYLVFLALLGLP